MVVIFKLLWWLVAGQFLVVQGIAARSRPSRASWPKTTASGARRCKVRRSIDVDGCDTKKDPCMVHIAKTMKLELRQVFSPFLQKFIKSLYRYLFIMLVYFYLCFQQLPTPKPKGQ